MKSSAMAVLPKPRLIVGDAATELGPHVHQMDQITGPPLPPRPTVKHTL